MITPGNVPSPPRGRDLWERDPATWDQLRNLRWHLSILSIDAATYFGEGFKGVQELNKWAAAWAIDDLKRLLKIRDDEALQLCGELGSGGVKGFYRHYDVAHLAGDE